MPLGVSVNDSRITGTGTDELIVETASDPAATDLVGPIFGVQPNDWLTIAGSLQVDRHLVAHRDSTLDIGQRTVTLEFGLHCLFDILVGGVDRWQLDAQTGITGDGDLRADLTLGVESDLAAVGTLGDFDLGSGDQIDVVLTHGTLQILRYAITKCLLTSNGDADAGFENLARSLAGPKAWEAHLLGELAEGGIDIAIEFRFVDRNRQLDELLTWVSLEGFECAFHRPGSLSAAKDALSCVDRAEWGRELLEAPRTRQTPRRSARTAPW